MFVWVINQKLTRPKININLFNINEDMVYRLTIIGGKDFLFESLQWD